MFAISVARVRPNLIKPSAAASPLRLFPNSRLLSTADPPLVRYTQLPSRSLIKVGPDAERARGFIHGLVTAETKSLHYPTSSYYTSFLNAAGRVLDDVFVYPPPSQFGPARGGLLGQEAPDQYVIEVDTRRAPTLIRHLKKHKLRGKLGFQLLSHEEGPVYSIWTDEPNVDAFAALKPILKPLGSWKLDPRPNMGTRSILRPTTEMEQLLGPANATSQDYTVHRMLNGVAEGPAEIIPGVSLPQESNIDLFGGISFRKGCYLGQELTIRTHHTGVVRKRILPVQVYDINTSKPTFSEEPSYMADTNLSLPPLGADISSISSRKGRIVGKWLGGVGNIGLALCRLEKMTDTRLTEETAPYNPDQDFKVSWNHDLETGHSKELGIKAFAPRWMRIGIQERLQTLRNRSE